ncbi:hypothetical protein QL285_014479 [Trifolium repens]|nr:hypothetical protein QL285_014479 [Trifolium repens]
MPPRRAPTVPMADNVDVNQMAYAMHTMAAAVTAQSHAKAQRDLEKREREILAAGSRLLSNFNHQTPPKFNGEGGPETADLWLQSVERIFGAIHCPEGEKVVLATYQLLGGSEYWWRNTRIIMENGHEVLNWENFKRRFLAKYFPETARERDGIDEDYMCRRFQDGLRYELQDSVVPLGIRQFQVLVEKCQEVEDMRNKRVNRQGGSSAGGPSRTNDRGSTQNSGRQGSKPYNRPQHSKGPGRSVNQVTRGKSDGDCARKLVFFPEPGVRRKSVSVCSAQMASQQELLREFRDLHLEVEFALGNMRLGMITISSGLLEDIANCQDDKFLMEKRALIVRGTNRDFKRRHTRVNLVYIPEQQRCIKT